MKRIFLGFLNVFIVMLCSGQVDSVYKDVRITLKNFDEILGSKMIINKNYDDIFIVKKDNSTLDLKLNKIYSIEKQIGSKKFLYGLGGLAVGISAFIIIYNLSGWGDISSNVSSTTIGSSFFICTGAGFGIGFLIGNKQKRYQKIYYNGQFSNFDNSHKLK